MKWFRNKSLPHGETLRRAKVHSGNRNVSCIRYPALIQHGRSGRKERYFCITSTYIYMEAYIMFSTVKVTELGGWKVIPMLEFKSNRLVPIVDFSNSICRQMWTQEIKGKNETCRKLVRNSLATRTITNAWEENIWCVFVLQLQ